MTIKEIRLKNLLHLIEQNNLSQLEFAKKIGCSAAYLSQIISDHNKRNMGDVLARNIETNFNLYKGWMDIIHEHTAEIPKTEIRAKTQPEDAEILGQLRTWDDNAPLRLDEIVLPWLPKFNPFDGQDFTNMHYYPLHRFRFSKTTLKKLGIQEKAAYCIIMLGNSMDPVLPDGAMLGIDTDNTKIADGDIYAIDHQGSLRVKLIYRQPGGGLRLRSYNQHEWPDEYLTKDETHMVRIIGRLFWWSVLR